MNIFFEDFGIYILCVKYFNGFIRVVKINIVLKIFGIYF